MCAKWNQKLDHVFHNSGIRDEISHRYPTTFKLLEAQLQNTAAYLTVKADIQNVSYECPHLPNPVTSDGSNSPHGKKKDNFVEPIVRSVETHLDAMLPDVEATEVAKTIAEACLERLPELKRVPPDGHCLVANRKHNTFKSETDILFWSISYNLRLIQCTSNAHSISSTTASSPSAKNEYRLSGTLELYTFCCNCEAIENLEHRTHRDRNQVQKDIVRECRPMITSNEAEQPLRTEKVDLASFKYVSQNHLPEIQQNMEALLKDSIDATPNPAVIILTILQLENQGSTSADIVSAMNRISAYIEEHSKIPQKTLIVQNHMILVFSFENIQKVLELVRKIILDLAVKFGQPLLPLIIRQEYFLFGFTFDSVIGHIRG